VVAGANRGGGVAALVRSLEAALADAGVEIVGGKRVDEIRIEAGRAVGVRCGTERIDARHVVCNVPIWTAIDLVPANTFTSDFVQDARAWSCVGGVIASAFAFRGMPRLRETGQPDEFPGWTRLLIGGQRGFGGGMVWTTLHSPANAPEGFHVLQAMRLSPRRDVEDADTVAAVHVAFERMVREIYVDADERMEWSKRWTTSDSSEYMVSAGRRPPVIAPGIDGLYFVGETTDVPAVQMDAAALSAMRCAVELGAGSREPGTD
jgi:phytoene dehydrogenase-like protein